MTDPMDKTATELVEAFLAAWRDWNLIRRPPALPKAVWQAASDLSDNWPWRQKETTP